MPRTMFNTPLLRPLVAVVCRLCLFLRGWKLRGTVPNHPKYVLIAAPHTSNWDFPLALAIAFIYGIDLRWMGKDALFAGWRGPIMRWLGGIAIDRSRANNTVAQTVAAFAAASRLVVAIPPEGTRSRVETWKTGFYYIAQGAGVPIALAFLDYREKVGGFLKTFIPTGDIAADMAAIRACYVGITGKFPDKSTVA